jgi:hypothetical protein
MFESLFNNKYIIKYGGITRTLIAFVFAAFFGFIKMPLYFIFSLALANIWAIGYFIEIRFSNLENNVIGLHTIKKENSISTIRVESNKPPIVSCVTTIILVLVAVVFAFYSQIKPLLFTLCLVNVFAIITKIEANYRYLRNMISSIQFEEETKRGEVSF